MENLNVSKLESADHQWRKYSPALESILHEQPNQNWEHHCTYHLGLLGGGGNSDKSVIDTAKDTSHWIESLVVPLPVAIIIFINWILIHLFICTKPLSLLKAADLKLSAWFQIDGQSPGPYCPTSCPLNSYPLAWHMHTQNIFHSSINNMLDTYSMQCFVLPSPAFVFCALISNCLIPSL